MFVESKISQSDEKFWLNCNHGNYYHCILLEVITGKGKLLYMVELQKELLALLLFIYKLM